MAKSAAKSLHARNAARLKTTHLITLGLHVLFHIIRFTFRPSLSLFRYTLLTLPALALEAWLHVLATPTYGPDGSIRSAGSDLSEKGLTDFMWDVIYWTWFNLFMVTVAGNWMWWLYLVVPGYTIYAVATTVGGLKGMLGGMGGAGGAEGDMATTGSQSKRQAKMEKRGGQRVAYRA